MLAPFILDASSLVIEDTVLGSGAFGKVLRGLYKDQPVCVKVPVMVASVLAPLALAAVLPGRVHWQCHC